MRKAIVYWESRRGECRPARDPTTDSLRRRADQERRRVDVEDLGA